MTPEEVALVVDSAERLRSRMDAVADDFYARLFQDRPDVRALFPTDLAEQRRKFAAELTAIVTAIPHFGRFRERAVELGVRHRAYGVRASHYPLVRTSLLGALGAADPSWDETTEAAWSAAYDLVAEVMQSS